MSKTKRQRKNKKFKYNVNRKKLRKSRSNTGKAAEGVPIVKNAWEERKSIKENLASMGLSYDPNLTIKIPTSKESLETLISHSSELRSKKIESTASDKAHVAEELEAEAKAPRQRKFELPSGQVMWLSYLIEKYGDDYQAMARDNKNIHQETWKQIRSKIRTFQNIPSQWEAFIAQQSSTMNT